MQPVQQVLQEAENNGADDGDNDNVGGPSTPAGQPEAALPKTLKLETLGEMINHSKPTDPCHPLLQYLSCQPTDPCYPVLPAR